MRALHPRLILPKHGFTPETLAAFLAMMPDLPIDRPGSGLTVTRATLPAPASSF